eukprot:scaffold7963_cov116-Isochrysis_galbana.AAC.9
MAGAAPNTSAADTTPPLISTSTAGLPSASTAAASSACALGSPMLVRSRPSPSMDWPMPSIKTTCSAARAAATAAATPPRIGRVRPLPSTTAVLEAKADSAPATVSTQERSVGDAPGHTWPTQRQRLRGDDPKPPRQLTTPDPLRRNRAGLLVRPPARVGHARSANALLLHPFRARASGYTQQRLILEQNNGRARSQEIELPMCRASHSLRWHVPVRLSLNRVEEAEPEAQAECTAKAAAQIIHRAIAEPHPLQEALGIDLAGVDVGPSGRERGTCRTRSVRDVRVMLVNVLHCARVGGDVAGEAPLPAQRLIEHSRCARGDSVDSVV